MKPKKHQLNLKHQRATALRISGKGRETISVEERCEQVKLMALLGVGDPARAFAELEKDTVIKRSIDQISKGNLIHVDNTAPVSIVKANPRPVFNGELRIENGAMKQVTTIPDEVPADWEFEQLTPTHESDLPHIVEKIDETTKENVTIPRFLMEEFAKKE